VAPFTTRRECRGASQGAAFDAIEEKIRANTGQVRRWSIF
jgi:hypothetical protein